MFDHFYFICSTIIITSNDSIHRCTEMLTIVDCEGLDACLPSKLEMLEVLIAKQLHLERLRGIWWIMFVLTARFVP